MDISVRIARLAYRTYKIRLMRWGGVNIILKAVNRIAFGCDIAYQVNIPLTTRLPHQGLGLVIHPSVQIGECCTIYQNVTIGADGKPGHGNDAPIIGNNVMIGAGAVILGRIMIGDDAVVGANAVVISDVPPKGVVVGVPAKLKYIKD